ncbi:hypothetical protein PV783_13755 [Chitinophaga sp. CC14]|uniref:hypothetical protein n=1 Tax=Chitinophaga sp. CC14 TaxID=3029199 RepID=UPI003B7CE3D1
MNQSQFHLHLLGTESTENGAIQSFGEKRYFAALGDALQWMLQFHLPRFGNVERENSSQLLSKVDLVNPEQQIIFSLHQSSFDESLKNGLHPGIYLFISPSAPLDLVKSRYGIDFTMLKPGLDQERMLQIIRYKYDHQPSRHLHPQIGSFLYNLTAQVNREKPEYSLHITENNMVTGFKYDRVFHDRTLASAIADLTSISLDATDPAYMKDRGNESYFSSAFIKNGRGGHIIELKNSHVADSLVLPYPGIYLRLGERPSGIEKPSGANLSFLFHHMDPSGRYYLLAARYNRTCTGLVTEPAYQHLRENLASHRQNEIMDNPFELQFQFSSGENKTMMESSFFDTLQGAMDRIMDQNSQSSQKDNLQKIALFDRQGQKTELLSAYLESMPQQGQRRFFLKVNFENITRENIRIIGPIINGRHHKGPIYQIDHPAKEKRKTNRNKNLTMPRHEETKKNHL